MNINYQKYKNMSNDKKIEKYLQILQLRARLTELTEARAYLGNTQYFSTRRRVLAQAIEAAVLDLLGLQQKLARPIKTVVVEVEREVGNDFSFGDMELSVEKSLVNEEQFNPVNSIARAFGIQIPKDMSNVDQYLVTEIRGLLR